MTPRFPTAPTRPRLLAGTFLLLGAAAVAAGCDGADAADARPEQTAVTLRPGDLIVIAPRDLASGPALSGSLVAERQATLRAEASGTVIEVRAEPGQAVGPGAVLVRLDASAIAEAVRSAESARRSALEALTVARRNAERAERLEGVGAIAAVDLEQARTAATGAEAGLADAEARLAAARRQLATTVLRAPFGGVVSERPVRVGDVVQTGTSLVSVVDPRSLRLEAAVPVAALEGLEVGTPVDFTVGGVADRAFRGEVIRINPVVDPGTGQVRVVAAIPNAEGRLIGGLFAQGRVATVRRTALAVPVSALDARNAVPSVRRIRGGAVEIVAVSLGLRDDAQDLVEVLSGLAAGDTVLVGGARGLAAGARVMVVRE